MAKLLTKKFIGNKEIDGEKIKLLSGQSIKAETTSGTEVELIKVDSSGKVFAMGSEVGKKSDIDQIASDIFVESVRANEAEQLVQTNLNQEIMDRQESVQDLQDQIDQEISDRSAADADLQSQIDALSGSSGSSLASLEASLTQEIANRIADVNSEEARAMSQESYLLGQIQSQGITLNQAISNESNRAQSAEAALGVRIDHVVSNVDPAALDSLTEVVAAFQAADASLNGAITSLASSASSGLSAEISRAQAAESAISSSLASEVSRAQTAEGVLDGKITQEKSDRQAAIFSVQTSLNSEITRATNSEVVLGGRLSNLENKQFEKEKKTLSSTDVSNGYVKLSHAADPKSIVGFVDRLAIHEGEDYTVSIDAGVTKITFAGDIAVSGVSPLEAGDTVYFKYHY
jgi:hypothetical protein